MRQLRVSYPNDGPPLILCPAGLKPMWQAFNERFGLGAEVVSHSVIASPPGPEFDEELGRYVEGESPERGIILEQELFMVSSAANQPFPQEFRRPITAAPPCASSARANSSRAACNNSRARFSRLPLASTIAVNAHLY